MEGCRCIASLGSDTCGLFRCCTRTVADHVHDLVVNYASLRPAHMVFIKLFDFFSISFEHRCRIIPIIGLYAGYSGFTSLRLAQSRRQHRHLFPDYFVYSGKQASSTSFAPPFFYACDRRGGHLC
jgi:hypothetical protein